MKYEFVDRRVRPATAAGRFYTRSPEKLWNEVEEYLANAPAFEGDARTICAAAVPHAGYVYSARIAAPVFKALQDSDFETIVIIGHDYGRNAPGIIAVLPSFTHYQTPLGEIPVDQELCEALLQSDKRIVCADEAHLQEHTIEVQLPFLQVTGHRCKILPVLFGEVTPVHCRRFAQLLDSLRGNRKLFVLSSTDLSHYPSSSLARTLDAQTVQYATAFDLENLCEWKNGGKWEDLPGVETPICSAGGLGTAIAWAELQGAKSCLPLRQGNSGDVPGAEKSSVVGYASLLFCKEAKKEEEFSVSPQNQKALLEIVRKALRAGTEGYRYRPVPPEDKAMLEKAAVFVTLHEHGRLRGCIGTLVPHRPLYLTVAEYAYAAGFEDPRFQPVTEEELPELDLEVSVLSPLRKIASAEEIVPGKHGVVVTRGRQSGVFLPQVWEQLPRKEDFLSYLCAEKAGLPPDAWRDANTTLEVFTVFAFEEKAGR